ncbi:MAG TPA: TPM domain-containing protein [Candidatus Deferrimicrobiaceae bacterium]|nr:TPM domain-containing protein [Candidatus Deferrimicrobiaceae bacterium]
MIAALASLVAAVAAPLAVTAQGQLPPPREGVYVYDFAGIWTDAPEQAAQRVAEEVRARTGAVIVIVSWPTGLARVTPEIALADARDIMRQWGVGRAGVDDGLVVLFDLDTSLAHGQVTLWAGDGFQDLYLNARERERIVNGDMLPRAVEGDLDAALVGGMEHIDRVVQPGGNPERALERFLGALVAAVAIGLGALVFGLFLRRWWLSGRDAPVPLIDDSVLLPTPPRGLTPAMATVLRRDVIDNEAFTSAMVDLGHRGLVTFRADDDDEKKVDLLVPPEPLVELPYLEARRRPLGVAENALEQAIERKARDLADGWEILTSEKLRAGAGKELYAAFRKELGRAAKAAGWYRDDPNRLTGRWQAIGIAVIVVAAIAFGLVAFDASEGSSILQPGRELPAAALALMGGFGLLMIVLSGRLVARTADGSRVLAMALAYRNTLRFELKNAQTVDEAVEHTKPRLPWITTPDLLTVWAVAFGLKSEMDDLIRETFRSAERSGGTAWSPAWYIGASGGGGWGSSGVAAVSGLGAAIGSISASASSGGGGGFGGGGGGGGGGSSGGF